MVLVQEPTESPTPPREAVAEDEDKEVYVALNNDVDEGKQTLIWVLRNTPKETKIILVHIHPPAQRIPVLGGNFLANQASEEEVAAHRNLERQKIEQQLDEYINMCELIKVKKAEKLVIESDDVGKGLIKLIAQHGITKLVMGATDRKFHWRSVRGPRSKAALTVLQQADLSCNVMFLYKGNLICTRPRSEGASTSTNAAKGFSEFSYSVLKLATQDFAESLKIGVGGYGSVYKGFLRRRQVAIKLLKAEGEQGEEEFLREVNVLGNLRHPNLVTLIGACLEKYALVYEFVPNGSLEDRLARKGNTPALTWQERTRIAAEICSALAFLHSKPRPIVHSDLKPENILLDENLVSKLGDFGLSRLLVQSMSTTTFYHRTSHVVGTRGYMDPEVLNTLEFTTRSDMYSFGVILLRLLTGKPPIGIVQDVQRELEQGLLYRIIDPSAGQWPYVHALLLAELGLKCCERARKKRPRARDALQKLEPWIRTKAASSGETSRKIPSHFICPILQKTMRNPYKAADGYTYEAIAIRKWLRAGFGISPMTGRDLAHRDISPHADLCREIQEWLHEDTGAIVSDPDTDIS